MGEKLVHHIEGRCPVTPHWLAFLASDDFSVHFYEQSEGRVRCHCSVVIVKVDPSLSVEPSPPNGWSRLPETSSSFTLIGACSVFPMFFLPSFPFSKYKICAFFFFSKITFLGDENTDGKVSLVFSQACVTVWHSDSGSFAAGLLSLKLQPSWARQSGKVTSPRSCGLRWLGVIGKS